MVEFKLAAKLIIPKARGRAFEVKKGQVFRLTCIDGSQVADMDVFNRKDFKEAFSSSFTRSVMGAHLTTGAQLLSDAPHFRPLMTIVADTVGLKPSRQGAVSHDVMLGRCNRKLHEWFTGNKRHPNCQDNLARAIKPYGMEQHDVHDPFNVFMRTGLGKDGRFFYEDPLAKQGDYVEFRADVDCLVAISACPGKSSGPVPNRLGVEIFDIVRSRGVKESEVWAHIQTPEPPRGMRK